MDMIETIDAIFEGVLLKIIECANDATQLENVLNSVKRSVICAAASNPINTTYILNITTPKEYICNTENKTNIF
jgi:hypothetical protein